MIWITFPSLQQFRVFSFLPCIGIDSTLSLELALLAFFGGGVVVGGIETREGSKSSQKFANLSLPLAGNCYGNVISAREKAICRLHLRGPLVSKNFSRCLHCQDLDPILGYR